MLIIGITGSLGAGKGTISDYLVKNKNFRHFSVRDLLVKEIKRRRLPVNRDSMVTVGNDLRKKYGPSYLAETLYKIAFKTNKDCVIESLRAPAEVMALKQKDDFYLFAVDANLKTRYKRNLKRAAETDNRTYGEFLNDEKREMSSKDPTKQNLRKCILMADYKFENNGSKKDLYKKVAKVIDEINRKTTGISLSPKAKKLKLGFYEHYKKIKCQIISVAIHSETLEEYVVYKELRGKKLIWIRPLKMFLEKVEVDRKRVPRFKYLGKTI